MRPDRVVIAVEGGGPTGGAERIAFDTVKILSDEGIPVTILSSAKTVDPAYASLPGIDTVSLDLPLHFERFFGLSKLGMISNLFEDREMRSRFATVLGILDKPNTVFHVHGFHNFFTQASLHVASGLSMRTVLTCHDFGITCPTATLFNYNDGHICPLKPLSGECRNSACMGANAVRLKQLRFARTWANSKLHRIPQKLDKILAVSDFERQILQSQLPEGVKVEILSNPVDPAATTRQNPSGSKGFLWIGRMTQEKDGITPARICGELGLPITFVGDGPQRAEIAVANPKAKLLGWLSSEAVKPIQCGVRALILSSKWYETASLVVLECLAAGIPCIVPDTSAATNWIEDGINGLTFQVGNPESLAAAIQKLSDDALVEKLSLGAFERYWKAPFTVERYTNDLLRIYDEALAS